MEEPRPAYLLTSELASKGASAFLGWTESEAEALMWRDKLARMHEEKCREEGADVVVVYSVTAVPHVRYSHRLNTFVRQ